MRLIDGDSLFDKLESVSWFDNADRDIAEKAVLDMPTVCDVLSFATYNKPLTLEELRGMNGEPAWGMSLTTDKPGEWFIVRVVEMSKTWFIACAGSSQVFGDTNTYGQTWFAYRHPVESGSTV